MEVDPRTAPASAEWNGVTVHFCNLRCRDRFLETPEKFLPRERRKGSCCI
jgi:YHS domain-containing protein